MLFDKLPGINPKKWPSDLEKLLEKLENMPVFGLFNEPLHYHQDFFRLAQEFLDERLATIKNETLPNEKKALAIEHLTLACKVLVLIYLLSGEFSNYVKSILVIQKTSQSLASTSQKLEFLNHLTFFASLHINKLRILSESTARLHYARNLCDEGGFKISKVAHFQKQSFLTSSLTTDGIYLYLYVSATNGGMYKIGTGQKDTIPGKIYLFAAVCRQEEVAWVYCKGKLYLRSSNKEFGSIDIIDPNTFKFEGMIQLYCPEVFGHPSLQIINKNYPLLSDGEFLYVIGKKLISEKINTAEEEEKKEEKLLEEDKKEPDLLKLPSIIKVPSNKFALMEAEEKEAEAQEIIREEAERIRELEEKMKRDEEENFKKELEKIKEMEEKSGAEQAIIKSMEAESKREYEENQMKKEKEEAGQEKKEEPKENLENKEKPQENKEKPEENKENKENLEENKEKAEENKEIPQENQEKPQEKSEENKEKLEEKKEKPQENQEKPLEIKEEPKENKEVPKEIQEPSQELKEPPPENKVLPQENKVPPQENKDQPILIPPENKDLPLENKDQPQDKNEEIKDQPQENKDSEKKDPQELQDSEKKEPPQEKKELLPQEIKPPPQELKEPPISKLLPDISDKNLQNFDQFPSLDGLPPEKNDSKQINPDDFEPDFFKPKMDSKSFKELMDKGDLKDIFKEKDSSEVFKEAGKKSSLFNKKTLEKEKPNPNIQKREELKKKKEKKVNELVDSEHTLKLCEFILYEFDLANPLGIECFNESNSISLIFLLISWIFSSVPR